MTLVYIVNTYDEYGPEEIIASLDPSKLRAAITSAYPATSGKDEPLNARQIEEKKDWLARALAKLDQVLETGGTGSHELHNGWGGLQLHIVEMI